MIGCVLKHGVLLSTSSVKLQKGRRDRVSVEVSCSSIYSITNFPFLWNYENSSNNHRKPGFPEFMYSSLFYWKMSHDSTNLTSRRLHMNDLPTLVDRTTEYAALLNGLLANTERHLCLYGPKGTGKASSRNMHSVNSPSEPLSATSPASTTIHNTKH